MSQMNRRRALQLLAALGTTGLVAGCGTDDEDEPAAAGSPIKIGLVAPESGSGKTIGEDIVNGFELYLATHGQRLGGHPVTLVKADEGDNAKTGQAALLGGGPAEHPDRYAAADPRGLVPLRTRTVIVHGVQDQQVPVTISRGYLAAARAAGADVRLVELPKCEHFGLIDPESAAWPQVREALQSLHKDQ
ncbi:ABC transporter substrate-binding protein [Micromonospora sp. 4G55]|nr:ABC transporter substrate-binding protein [Micromonospora sp. 4G55]